MRADPKSTKTTVKPSVGFAFLGFACLKAAHKMLLKLKLKSNNIAHTVTREHTGNHTIPLST